MPKVEFHTIRKVALTGLGAIVLGAIGSGVWERLLGPALSYAQHGLFNIANILSRSYSGYVYSEIAKGFHEEAALTLYGMSVSLALATFLWMVVESLEAQAARRQFTRADTGLTE